MTRAAAMIVIAVGIAACESRAPVASCTDNLHGVWRTEAGARWMLLDNGRTLELYPLFDDSIDGGAPRVIDLRRGDKLAGEAKRRYTRGGEACEAKAPANITACSDDALQLVVADPPPPLSFAPCEWGRAPAARVERWRRD